MSVAANPAGSNPPVSQFITTPHELADKIRAWKAQGAHVLAPAIQISTIAAGYGVNAAEVYFDPTVDEHGRGLDVYFDKASMRQHERGPGKIGLGRLAAAAGVSWIGAQSGRRDPLTIQNLWIYQIVGVYLAYDGTPQTIHGEKEIDYRDGSAQIGDWTPERWREALAAKQKDVNGWSEQRVRKARMNGAERAETGAMERAIRMGFGIKHTYTVDELRRPFIALRVCPIVDLSDAVVRQMVTAGQIAGVASLYSNATRRLPAPNSADVIDISTRREPLPATATMTAQTAQPTPPPAGQTAQPTPPVASQTATTPEARSLWRGPAFEAPEPAKPADPPKAAVDPKPDNIIRDVKTEQKTYGANHRNAGQPFTKWHVTTGDGVTHCTIRSKFGEAAERYWKGQVPVVIRSERNDYNEMVISALETFGTGSRAAAAPQQGGFKL